MSRSRVRDRGSISTTSATPARERADRVVRQRRRVGQHERRGPPGRARVRRPSRSRATTTSTPWSRRISASARVPRGPADSGIERVALGSTARGPTALRRRRRRRAARRRSRSSPRTPAAPSRRGCDGGHAGAPACSGTTGRERRDAVIDVGDPPVELGGAGPTQVAHVVERRRGRFELGRRRRGRRARRRGRTRAPSRRAGCRRRRARRCRVRARGSGGRSRHPIRPSERGMPRPGAARRRSASRPRRTARPSAAGARRVARGHAPDDERGDDHEHDDDRRDQRERRSPSRRRAGCRRAARRSARSRARCGRSRVGCGRLVDRVGELAARPACAPRRRRA